MKTPIRKLDSLTHNDTAATKLINDNFEALQQGVEDAISRSGKKPNFMDDVLDMNMHRIINIADPVDNYDFANKHYIDTKVAEEETARRNADTAITNSIGNGTITFTQGGVVKGTFTTNQKTNTTIDLDTSNSAKNIYLNNKTMTFNANSAHAYLDVSNYVKDGVAYFPTVFISSPDVSITPRAVYKVANKYVYLSRNTDNDKLQKTVNVYVCLVPVNTNETEVWGLSNGLSYTQYAFINKANLVTTITSSSTDAQVPSAKSVYDVVNK